MPNEMNTSQGNEQVDDSIVQELKDIQRSSKEVPPAPVSPQIPQQAKPRSAYAGFWRRFLAVVIDSILLNGIIIFINGFLYYGGRGFRAGLFTNLETLLTILYPTSAYRDLDDFFYRPVPMIIAFALPLLYYAIMQSMRGQTVGKMILRIKVVRYDGSLMSFGVAIIRNLAKIISGIPINLGYLWMLWDKERRTWHDMIVKTHVIKITK